jgi:hypothetical protein
MMIRREIARKRVPREAYLVSRISFQIRPTELTNDEIRDTSDELGTTLHAQVQRIRDCSRSVHE